MLALRIFLLMITLAPIRGAKDYDYRWLLAEQITLATDDPREQEVLARIAWFESGYRRNVARCEIKGDNGKSLGVFQVQPMSARDAKAACGSLIEQVEVGLRYVRRSASECPKNEGAALLNLYVSGRCGSPTRALPQAVARWGVQ